MSPRLELLRPELPGAEDLEERTKRPLLLVGILGSWAPFTARVGLEDGAYRMGDESVTVSDPFLWIWSYMLPPGGARGVLPATEASFKGELIFIWSLPFGTVAREARDARGVPWDCDLRDLREAGEDMVAYECWKLFYKGDGISSRGCRLGRRGKFVCR